jgi:hypothetical protein
VAVKVSVGGSGVSVGILVEVGTGVSVGVLVSVGTRVSVGVRVEVRVGVRKRVRVKVGVWVIVGVPLTVGVGVIVLVREGVLLITGLTVSVRLYAEVGVRVPFLSWPWTFWIMTSPIQ